MTINANMTKKVPTTGVMSDKTPDLFLRHETASRFRGFATFDTGNGISVLLEVADTPELKAKGLSGRDTMLPCCGMVFTELTGGAFWMKGCKVPLDIVFLDKNDEITRIYSMPVDGGVKKYYYDDEPTAIELPAGFCENYNIGVGTKCKWRVW